ncbi:MAG TPA: HTTM domain-containing protein, partial [Gemmataceae bacterium]|nr:HTTM domain-containing protein [Gemmataceae bacterium]
VDTMMTILLLYLMIGPSGAALSADRWLARWWAQARPRILARWRAFWHRDSEAPLPSPIVLGPPEPSITANFAIRLLQVHVCIIYLAAGLSKLQGMAWWNGTAVWSTLANFEFAPMQYESYMIPLRLLTANRLVWEVMMTSAGIFTLFFEITYTFLIWRPSTRWLILSMAVVLHGFIGIFMGLKTFSLMMLVMNMAFLRPQEVSFMLHPFTRRKPMSIPNWSEAALPLQPAGAGAPSVAFRHEPKSLSTGAGERVKRKHP